MLNIIKITPGSPFIAEAQRLVQDYVCELDRTLDFQDIDNEVEDLMAKYGPPSGAFLMAFFNEKPIGCIALKRLETPATCEMKRLYIEPVNRKMGIGDTLVKVLLQEAKEKGYQKMVLDTLDTLQAAIKTYENNGFQLTEPYYYNPLDGVVFMEKIL